jgi:HD-like signal output (HDOD) protein
MNKVIVNCETGEQETIPLKGAELAEFLANEEAAIAKQTAEQTAEEAKAAEKAALLAKLGITDDEAKLLLS